MKNGFVACPENIFACIFTSSSGYASCKRHAVAEKGPVGRCELITSYVCKVKETPIAPANKVVRRCTITKGPTQRDLTWRL